MQSLREILNNDVLSSQTQKKIGQIKEAIIDPHFGKIIVFELNTFLKKPFLVLRNIVDLKETEVILSKEENLLDESDLPKILEIKKNKIKVLGARVYTKDNEYLGKVSDLIFDELNGEILRYYISRPFFKSPLKAYLILGKDDIIKIEKRGIIVRDLEELETAKAIA